MPRPDTPACLPAFIRGETITTDLVPYGGRDGTAHFLAPEANTLVERLALTDPSRMHDVAELSFDEIVAYLADLGKRLKLEENELLQHALDQSAVLADLTEPLIRASFEEIPGLFAPEVVREVADMTVGLPYLQGWVERRLSDGRTAAVRAFGARAVHIIAGNSPVIAALSIIRNAITRSDAVIKTPSNDPFTALAIARTMGAMAPDHPLTRHLAVAYWKGGDVEFERRLYQPSAVEKIIAWGGLASVQHVTRYVQPGLELVTLDPKRSVTIIGSEAFADETRMRDTARRAATDIGALNQLACVNARVIYAASGTDTAGVERLNRFGELVYEELIGLPAAVSTRAKRFDPEVRAELAAARAAGKEWFHVIGGTSDEGAIVVSQESEPVDFHRSLSGRTANLVPIDHPLDAVRGMTAYTQTVGVYPESLKTELRDHLPLYGAQRLVSLGYAASVHTGLPQDAVEPVRRMVKWIVEETCDPSDVRPLWSGHDQHREQTA